MTGEKHSASYSELAAKLGMTSAHFVDPAGLSCDNVASAEDLSKLVDASQIPAGAKTGAEKLLEIARTNFVERMSTNRAPMGVPVGTGIAL